MSKSCFIEIPHACIRLIILTARSVERTQQAVIIDGRSARQYPTSEWEGESESEGDFWIDVREE